MPSPTVERSLVALKATINRNVSSHCWENSISFEITVDRNVNSHYWQGFGSSKGCIQQDCQLPLLTRIWWFWKLRSTAMSTLTTERILVARKVTVVNSNSWWEAESLPCFRYPWKLWSTGMSTPTAERSLVALKNMVNRNVTIDRVLLLLKATVHGNVNSHCWQDFGSSKSCGQLKCQLPLLTGFWYLWKLQLSTPIVNRKQSLPAFRQLWKTQSTEMSAPIDNRILMALKATVVNFKVYGKHRVFWILGSSESYSFQLIVDGRHSMFKVLRSSESYGCQLW